MTTGLFLSGTFRLASGAVSPFKIDCDVLADADLATAAAMLARRLPPFGSVDGVPTGGLRLAEVLRQYATTGPVLIVDDVLTTGGSMERQRAGREAVGAVLFARGQQCPDWVVPLFVMTLERIATR